MHLDERQVAAGLVGEKIDREVESGVVGQQHLQVGGRIAEEGRALDFRRVCDDRNREATPASGTYFFWKSVSWVPGLTPVKLQDWPAGA